MLLAIVAIFSTVPGHNFDTAVLAEAGKAFPVELNSINIYLLNLKSVGVALSASSLRNFPSI